jgi:hypothetical protein
MVEKGISNEPKNPKRSGPAEGSIESALHHVGGGVETAPDHDSSLTARRERVARERRALREWAEENGKLKGKLPKEHARGGEHIVQLDPERGRVLKATRPEANFGFGIAYGSQTPGATPSEYLDRLVIHNRIFNDRIKLECVIPAGPGMLSIVTSQPFVKGRDAEQTEINSMMRAKGFEQIGEGMFYHSGEGPLVHDLPPKNGKVSESGYVHAIDPVVQRITPDFAGYPRRNSISGDADAEQSALRRDATPTPGSA